jgi:hypothetical protein
MASIKLGQLLALGGGLTQGLTSNLTGQQTKAAAQDLLKKSKLEIPSIKEPTAHMKADPLAFSQIQFPADLGNSEQGHYMIFYTVSSKHSTATDLKFAEDLKLKSTGSFQGFSDADIIFNYDIPSLRSKRGGDEIKIGKGTTNSVNSKRPVHNIVTSAIALYMPPAIKVSYSVNNGPTELGLGGLGAKMFAETTSASSSEDQIGAFLKGAGGFALEATKRLGIGLSEAAGVGDVSGAITKITGFAENPFSEVVFEKVNHRQFSYTFNLQARNKDEVTSIDKIIKLFKFHMHPELENDISGGRYFKVPSEFEIHYAYKDQVNNYLNKISRCVLTDVSVDYGGDQFSTFRQFDDLGAAPVNVQLALSFTETEIMTKNLIAQGY